MSDQKTVARNRLGVYALVVAVGAVVAGVVSLLAGLVVGVVGLGMGISAAVQRRSPVPGVAAAILAGAVVVRALLVLA